LLIVDDDVRLAHAVSRNLSHAFGVKLVHSFCDARRALAEARWSGFIIDVVLGDELDGLDLLAIARGGDFSQTPAVVVSGLVTRDIVNRAARLGARFIGKPWAMADMAAFMEDVRACTGRRIENVALATRLRFNLTVREEQVLEAQLRGDSRETFLKTHDLALSTYKTHVASILEKTDSDTMANLLIDLLRVRLTQTEE
jgi:FixJ family two-component response regulator